LIARIFEQAEHLGRARCACRDGPYQTFMDAHGERHGEGRSWPRCTSKPTACMECPHDCVLGLGVGFRLLMQELYGRHFLAALGALMPSRPGTSRPLTDTRPGTACSTACAHKRKAGRVLDAAVCESDPAAWCRARAAGSRRARCGARAIHPHRQARHGR